MKKPTSSTERRTAAAPSHKKSLPHIRHSPNPLTPAQQRIYPPSADAGEDANFAGRFVDVMGLAGYLGLHTSWIYDRTGPSAADRIPHFKIGKYLRFDIHSEEFKAWLNRNFRN
jgi:hypothetical protein